MPRNSVAGGGFPSLGRGGAEAAPEAVVACARALLAGFRAAAPWMVACLLVTGPSGCGREPKSDLLAEAEQLVVHARWDKAIPVLKRHLLEYPNDAGAHFYLGRCYLNAESKVPMMVFALGELETALDLFKTRGQPNTIARFSDSYFELICHIERTKVCLKQLEFVASQSFGNPRVRRGLLEEILERCEQDLHAARLIDPGSEDVADLERILLQLRRALGLETTGRMPSLRDPAAGNRVTS